MEHEAIGVLGREKDNRARFSKERGRFFKAPDQFIPRNEKDCKKKMKYGE